MADTKTPGIGVPLYDIEAPFKPESVSPGALAIPELKEEYDKILDANSELTDALKKRYQTPNWFKVAAGFAKPQLGGFLASLGSAAEARGENVEQERAIEPTIAMMKAKIGAGRFGQSVKIKQDQLWKDYQQSGKKDPDRLAQIYAIDPKSETATAIKQQMDIERSERERATGSLGVQEKILAQPALKTEGTIYTDLTDPQKRAAYIAGIENGKVGGYSDEAWSKIPFPEKERAVALSNREKAEQYLTEGQKAANEAENSYKLIGDVAVLRKLAVDPEMKPLFSLGSTGGIFSELRAAMAKFPGNKDAAIEAVVAAQQDRLKNASPETRAKFDELVKGIYNLEVDTRGSLVNPTDAATALNSYRSPNLANSQAGFVGILDQIGLGAHRNIQYNNLRKSLKLSKQDSLGTDQDTAFRLQTEAMKRDLAGRDTLKETPEWYKMTQGSFAEPKKPAVIAPASGSAAPRRLRSAADILREAGVNP